MKPIFITPIYKDYIWGGNNIETYFKRELNHKIIAESWELSAHKNGLSIVKGGEFNGKSLLELFEDCNIRKDIFGSNCEKLDRFPILIKFIDASNKLSIQVHPKDEYAKKYENDSGKTEVWYIIDCKENSKIIYGLKPEAINKTNKEIVNNIDNYINYVNVKKGDFIIIPAGTIHAILDGILICEVQQSSDVTYRVHDWNRLGKDGKPRQLHIEKAIDVIDNNVLEIKNYENVIGRENAFISDYFNVQIIKIEGKEKINSNITSFEGYTVIEGKGTLLSKNFTSNIVAGDTFLIPAKLGKYQIKGNIKLIKVWI